MVEIQTSLFTNIPGLTLSGWGSALMVVVVVMLLLVVVFLVVKVKLVVLDWAGQGLLDLFTLLLLLLLGTSATSATWFFVAV